MPRGSADVASEHIAEDGELYPDCIMMQLISFNFGIHQDISAPERVDEDRATVLAKRARKLKEDLRYGKTLQHREQKRPGLADSLEGWEQRLLREAKDGSLKRKVNTAVLAIGRGRLRGDNDDDYVDIGTNRERSVVARILDGQRPLPETSRFERE